MRISSDEEEVDGIPYAAANTECGMLVLIDACALFTHEEWSKIAEEDNSISASKDELSFAIIDTFDKSLVSAIKKKFENAYQFSVISHIGGDGTHFFSRVGWGSEELIDELKNNNIPGDAVD